MAASWLLRCCPSLPLPAALLPLRPTVSTVTASRVKSRPLSTCVACGVAHESRRCVQAAPQGGLVTGAPASCKDSYLELRTSHIDGQQVNGKDAKPAGSQKPEGGVT